MSYFSLLIMAATIWGEARGETLKGQAAVAWVIKNRALDRRWPNSLGEVCVQDRQFSVWNNKDPNRSKMVEAGLEDRGFLAALSVTTGVLAGLIPDPTEGANHYHHHSLTPGWADPDKLTVQIGDHKFYKL